MTRSIGRARAPRKDDSGSATVEFALLLPAVLGLLAGILGIARWASEQSTVETAAAAAARTAAVSTDAAAQHAAQQVADSMVTVTVARDGRYVQAYVAASPVLGLPVEATAVAVAPE